MAENKPWIQTASGLVFELESPTPEMFVLEDIAHHLSRINRFTGAIVPEAYSVAEHSVRVAIYTAELVARELNTHNSFVLQQASLAGLMHDAHEAYLNDLSSPLKKTLKNMGETGYEVLGQRYDALLSEKYHLPSEFKEYVHDADLQVLELERKHVKNHTPKPWATYKMLAPVEISGWAHPLWNLWGWSPNLAKIMFLKKASLCGLK